MNSSQPGHLLEILVGEEKFNMLETNKMGLSEMVVLLMSIGLKFFVSYLDNRHGFSFDFGNWNVQMKGFVLNIVSNYLKRTIRVWVYEVQVGERRCMPVQVRAQFWVSAFAFHPV